MIYCDILSWAHFTSGWLSLRAAAALRACVLLRAPPAAHAAQPRAARRLGGLRGGVGAAQTRRPEGTAAGRGVAQRSAAAKGSSERSFAEFVKAGAVGRRGGEGGEGFGARQ